MMFLILHHQILCEKLRYIFQNFRLAIDSISIGTKIISYNDRIDWKEVNSGSCLLSGCIHNQNHEEMNHQKLVESIKQYFVFTEQQLNTFESNVNDIVEKAINGQLKQLTVDHAPLRNKYFFGERYTYGTKSDHSGPGSERLYPKHFVDPIPNWITESIINPLTEAKIIPKNFVNSVVINDYQPGGCIVSHVDPPQIFDRPLISLNLFSDCMLCFGCKFEFKPIRCSEPVLKLDLPRGVVTSLSGYSANEITHCVRPQDVVQRRAVIMLRRVHSFSPRLTLHTCEMENVGNKILKGSNQLNIQLPVKKFKTAYQYMQQLFRYNISSAGVSKRTYRKKNLDNKRFSDQLYVLL